MTRATERAYSELQQAFDFYNQRLFDGELPDCLITFQRGKKGSAWKRENNLR